MIVVCRNKASQHVPNERELFSARISFYICILTVHISNKVFLVIRNFSVEDTLVENIFGERMG